MHEWSSMRQRKPYGRAYDHKIDGPNASGNKKAEPFFIPKAYRHQAEEGDKARPRPKDLKPQEKSVDMTTKLTATAVALMGILAIYVTARDSAEVQGQLLWHAASKASMNCTQGVVYYPEDSLADRLMGKGFFQCTNWKVKNG